MEVALQRLVLIPLKELSSGFPCAVYGGFFIFLSYAWGWAVDKEKPDAGAVQLLSYMRPGACMDLGAESGLNAAVQGM